MKPQIYMWSETRQRILQRHDFYVAQTKARVLANFADIESDADDLVRMEYDRLGASESEEPDSAWADERHQESCSLLNDLRKQIFLGALAGCFHQWEKDLRDFLERELLRDFEPEGVKKLLWSNNFMDVYNALKDYGWNYSAGKFFARLEAGRLIVNVYKHGNGDSLGKLAEDYPEYLPRWSGSKLSLRFSHPPDHDWLEVSEAQFDELASAIRSFWEAFPERLFLNRLSGDS